MRAGILALGLAAGFSPPLAGVRHDVHVSEARVVLEGTTVALRLQCYRHDLERGLRGFAGNAALRLTEADRADGLVQRYLGRTLRLEVNGSLVVLRVTASGLERDAVAEEVVWYLAEGVLPAPAQRLLLLDTVLFEQFQDQQNVVHLLSQPGGERRTLYFSAREPRPQFLTLPAP